MVCCACTRIGTNCVETRVSKKSSLRLRQSEQENRTWLLPNSLCGHPKSLSSRALYRVKAMAFFALNLLDSGVQLSMLCAVIGLIFAFVLIAIVARSPAGNERMRQISGAVLEGAKAYLNRQVVTISVIAVIIFILLFIFKDHPTAIGFVVRAVCSLSAGFIRIRIAVTAHLC